MARARQDSVDRHVARWSGLLENMDPEVEGAVTRMQAITKRLKAADHASYAAQTTPSRTTAPSTR